MRKGKNVFVRHKTVNLHWLLIIKTTVHPHIESICENIHAPVNACVCFMLISVWGQALRVCFDRSQLPCSRSAHWRCSTSKWMQWCMRWVWHSFAYCTETHVNVCTRHHSTSWILQPMLFFFFLKIYFMSSLRCGQWYENWSRKMILLCCCNSI